jgi:hypothetical protein
MPFYRADAISLVQSYLRLGAGQELIYDNEIGDLIDNATQTHSKKFPREMRYDVIGNSEYNYALPSDWVLDFSTVLDVEFPGGDQIPNDIDRNTIRVIKVDTTARNVDNASSGATSITLSTVAEGGYFKDHDLLTITNGTEASTVTQTNWASADGNASTGALALLNALSSALDTSPTVAKANHLRFTEDTPTSTNIFTLKYGIPHTLSDTVTTLNSADCHAFCHLPASLVAYAISAKFGKHQISTIAADSVDYGAKVEEWRGIAEDQRKLYNDHFGIADEGEGAGVLAVGSLVDTDFAYQHGAKFLFHGGRYR